jgi:serine/threonine protein kinase
LIVFGVHMTDEPAEQENLQIAERWCAARGESWRLLDTAGRGGTAPVFSVSSPSGDLALKLYDESFSTGELGEESERRLAPQKALGLHDCPYLVRIHDAGRFEERLFVLMDRAPGQELEKRLKDVPREKVRSIIDQISKAAIFLRAHGLCHRDIKSANIFITDDFDHVTLLDLSVIREINDPIGLGTDHGGQLPVVATSRYSPPEYLFRLMEAGPELWHALDVYQIGGVLHDLIMREPMFEQEYQLTRDTNRYRFAWIVATQEPQVASSDVDPDLISLARRALDKNWERRSSIRLEDFLGDAETLRSRALVAIGANVRSNTPSTPLSQVNQRMTILSTELSEEIAAHLRGAGITSVHAIGGVDQQRTLKFSWDPQQVDGVEFERVCLELSIKWSQGPLGMIFATSATLSAKIDGMEKTHSLELPDVADNPSASAKLVTSVTSVLGDLAEHILRG